MLNPNWKSAQGALEGDVSDRCPIRGRWEELVRGEVVAQLSRKALGTEPRAGELEEGPAGTAGASGGDCPPSEPRASGRALGRALLTAGGHKPAVLRDTLAVSSLGFC